MKITFFGTRGSCPVSGERYLKYGGRTPCVLLETAGAKIILDCGTGIVELGLELEKSDQPINATILLSHLHLDHLIGLPFFAPMYNKNNTFTIYTESRDITPLKSQIFGFMKPPYFPVNLESFVGIRCEPIDEKGQVLIPPDITVKTFRAKHPDKTSVFRIEAEGKTLVYLLDYEIDFDLENEQSLINFVMDATAIIFDSCYSDETILEKEGWGHSSWRSGIELANRCNIKNLFLSHHSHEYDDSYIDSIGNYVENNNDICSNVHVAKDGAVFLL